jgi:hypothetical protein
MTARVTLIPAKCPPASCATCGRQIVMLQVVPERRSA